MGRVTSFSLGDHFNSFVEEQVKEGRYDNASEVMRAALRLLEEREARISVLCSASSKGKRAAPRNPLISRPLSPASGSRNARPHEGRLFLKPRAQGDLDAIWNYTANRWGLEQSEIYTRQLWSRIQAVAANPSPPRM